MVPFTIASNNSLGIFVLPVPAILGSVALVVLVPRRGALMPGGRASVSLNYKLWQVITPGHQEEGVLLLGVGFA